MFHPPGGRTVRKPHGPDLTFAIISGEPISFMDEAHGNVCTLSPSRNWRVLYHTTPARTNLKGDVSS